MTMIVFHKRKLENESQSECGRHLGQLVIGMESTRRWERVTCQRCIDERKRQVAEAL